MKNLSLRILAAASALNAVSAISLAPRKPSPRVVGIDISKKRVADPLAHDRSRLARRSGTVSVTLDNEETLYYADLTVGTPAQSLRLHIDTGSSDMWTNTPNSTLCDSEDGCAGGTYDPSSSSTYKFINSDFNISYVDGSGSSGDYGADIVKIGGITVDSLQFGLGFISSSAEGVLGIGYMTNEVQPRIANLGTYPNLPQALVDNGDIASKAYSLWLNDLDSSTGTILFGGVDTGKYTGSLATVPVLKEDDAYYEFLIALTGISIGGTTLTSSSSLPAAVLLDSGTTLTYLPDDLTTDIYNDVSAVYSSEAGIAYVDCSLRSSDSTIDFTFSGQTISVTYDELLLDAGTDSQGNPLTFSNGQEACIFGIAPADGSTPVLGDTFLRSAYVVYDLQNNEISLAQTDFNSTTTDVREIDSAGTVPGATAVASPVTTVAAGSTGGARLDDPSVTMGSFATGTSSDADYLQTPVALIALVLAVAALVAM